MNDGISQMLNRDERELTRRAFLTRCTAVAAGGIAFFYDFTVIASTAETDNVTPENRRAPVVSFFIDRPYLDTSGRATPYLPPIGTRSGQPLAAPSVEEILRRRAYL
jgi:hypothetical protein